MFKEVTDFFYNYAFRIGAFAGQALIEIASFSLIVRLLGAEGYGHYTLFSMVGGAILLFAANWIMNAIVRYGKEEFIKTNSIKQTFWGGISILLVTLAIAEIALYLLSGRITAYIGIPESYIFLVMLYIIATPLLSMVIISFQVTGRMKTFSSIRLVASITLLLLVIMAVRGIVPSKLTAIIALLILSSIVTLLIFTALIKRKHLLPITISKGAVKRILLYSYPLIFGGVSVFIIGWIDIAVIKQFLTVEQVGIYSVAYKVLMILTPLAMLTIDLTFPIITALFVNKQEDSIKVFTSRLTSQMLFIWTLPISILLILLNLIINLLFGSELSPAALPAIILTFGITFRCLSAFQSPIITTYALIWPTEIVGMFMVAMNFAGDWFLIPHFGIVAAAAVTTFIYAFESFSRAIIIDRRLKTRSFKNLAMLLPSMPIFMISLLTPNMFIRAIGFVVTYSIAILVIKKSNIYKMEDAQLFEAINMPRFLRQIIFRVYAFLSS